MFDMKTRLISIGNSRGIRIPASIIRECGLEGELELEVRDGQVLIAPCNNPRAGWEAAIKDSLDVTTGGGQALLPDDMPNEFDESEWTW